MYLTVPQTDEVSAVIIIPFVKMRKQRCKWVQKLPSGHKIVRDERKLWSQAAQCVTPTPTYPVAGKGPGVAMDNNLGLWMRVVFNIKHRQVPVTYFPCTERMPVVRGGGRA